MPLSVCACENDLRRVLHDLPHQGGDILADVLVLISEAGQRCREHVGLGHHLCQVHRVFADLTESREHLPLDGDKHMVPLKSYTFLSFLPFYFFS